MNLKKTLLTVTVMMGIIFLNFSVKAEEDGDLPPIRKLSRGIVNVTIGALEIPLKIIDTNHAKGGIAAVTYGALKGLCYFVARETIGIVEIVTFLIPFPEATDNPRHSGWGYGPLMRPEWVVDEEHDWYNIVYPHYSSE